MNINEQVVHDLLTRQIDLMRYERSVRGEVLQQLERMQREIEAKLRQHDLDALSKREMVVLLAEIQEILRRDYDTASGSLNTAEVVDDEAEWLFAWLTAAAAAYNLPTPRRLPENRRRELHNLLVGGLTVAEAFAKQRDDLFSRLKAQIRTDALDAAVTDTAALFRRARQYAEATTATWISAVANQTAYWVGMVNPLIKGWRHISVLDAHTSSVCLLRHGKLWDKRKTPIGHDLVFKVPPVHVHCRSRLVWVMSLDDEFNGISGEDWVESRTLAQLQEQFGQGVGQMLHDGTISLHDAVRNGGLQPMTLNELKQLNYAALSRNLRDRLAGNTISPSNISGGSVRTDWNNFPDVVLMHSKSTISDHPLYQAAKGGDLAKAVTLVDDYLNDGALNGIGKLLAPHGDVRLLPVHALEMSGRNKLPVAYAAWLEQRFGLPIEYGIVQADKVSRTGADGFERLVKSVRFDGAVAAGQKYLLIDDAVTQGGTLADLRGYIESRGGVVVGATTLMGKPHSARLAITKPTLGQLRKSLGREFEAWWQEQFGYDFSKLTESEARYINKQITRSGADAVRDTIIARRLEAISHAGS